MRGGDAGSLSIAASPQVIQTVLAPFITRFLRTRPAIDVRLVEEGGIRALELVERGEVHLASAVRRRADRLEGRLLFPIRVLAAMGRAYRLTRRPTIALTELQGERVLLLRPGFGTRELFDSACRVAGVHPRTVLEAGDPHTLLALAEAGGGVAIVPSTVWLAGRSVHLTPILHAEGSLGLWGWLVWDPQRYLPAFAKSFIDELTDYTRRSYPGRQFDRRAPPVPRPKE